MEEVIPAKNCHRFELRPSPGTEGQPTTGRRARVFMDGKPLLCCRSFNVKVEVGKFAVIQLELYGEVDLDVVGQPEVKAVEG